MRRYPPLPRERGWMGSHRLPCGFFGWGGRGRRVLLPLGVTPGEGRIQGELGKSGFAFPVASSFRGSCRRSDKLGPDPPPAPAEHPVPTLGFQPLSTAFPPPRAAGRHGHPPWGGWNPWHRNQGPTLGRCLLVSRRRPEHPTVTKGETRALQWRLKQCFRSGLTSPRSFGATNAPQISKPIASIFL